MSYKNGSVYIGQLLNGFRHGEGFYTRFDGSTYKGSFSYDQYDGYGEAKYNNSTEYEGNFSRGFKCGHGVFFYTNGDK